MPPDFSPPGFKPRTGTPFTDAFRRWEATASLTEKQAFADGVNAIAAGLRENPLPTRTDVEVLGPDDPKQEPLGWKMYERLGTTICKRDAIGTPLKENELAVGDEVLVPGLFGGYHVMTVEGRGDPGRMGAQNEALMAILALDHDEWVCVALINLRGVSKLTTEK